MFYTSLYEKFNNFSRWDPFLICFFPFENELNFQKICIF
ncbi:hypothetical protein HMPREF1150_2311 [Streptococcus sp. AS14]|nr:hypothetical protein HMPREF1150_2311 [Streptococcus sp. AS14]